MLIQGASALLTGHAGAFARRDPRDGCDLRIANGVIEAMGHLQPLPGEEVLDASDCVIYPGWVNTHHHLFQSLLKGVPAGIDQPLTSWLSKLPVRYRRYFDTEAMFRLAARVGLIELLRSGCTTVADHQYHYYPGMPFDASAALFDEAEQLGMRMVLCRGGATQARTIDVEPPREAAPETLDAFLAAIERDVGRFHQTGLRPMRQVVSAVTTPTWSTNPTALREMARQARQLGIRLHSHLSETFDYLRFCQEVHRCTPMQFVEANEWVGPDVWFAHMVHLDEAEIARCAASGTGVAHCPQSNARLGSGIAPVAAMLAAGVPVSLAVDGAASNEAADMISEAHACWLLHRANPAALRPSFEAPSQPGGQAWAMSVDTVVHIGTQQGARIMGLDGVGTIEVGMAADLAIYRLDDPRYCGQHDLAIAPVAAGGSPDLKAVLINGRVCLRDNDIPGVDLQRLAAQSRAAVRTMLEGQ
jgi:cytosine/adenosine deaminase-related metal-dependent hydrolase